MERMSPRPNHIILRRHYIMSEVPVQRLVPLSPHCYRDKGSLPLSLNSQQHPHKHHFYSQAQLLTARVDSGDQIEAFPFI